MWELSGSLDASLQCTLLQCLAIFKDDLLKVFQAPFSHTIFSKSLGCLSPTLIFIVSQFGEQRKQRVTLWCWQN